MCLSLFHMTYRRKTSVDKDASIESHGTRLRSPKLRARGGRRDRCTQVSKYAAGDGKGIGPPVTEVDWYWLLANMAEAPIARDKWHDRRGIEV